MKYHNLFYAVPSACIAAIVLSACGGNNPQPLPSAPLPSVSQTVEITEAPTMAPEPTSSASPRPTKTRPAPEPEPTREPTVKPEPTRSSASPSATPARPPGVEFAQRWGAKYPAVPEFAILRAANTVCFTTSQAGSGWADNTEAMAVVTATVRGAGLSGSDALEFAQDAQQNYCSSVSTGA